VAHTGVKISISQIRLHPLNEVLCLSSRIAVKPSNKQGVNQSARVALAVELVEMSDVSFRMHVIQS